MRILKLSKLVILLLASVFTPPSFASASITTKRAAPSVEGAACPNNTKHPIYCKIIGLSPGLDRNWAMHLSNVIHREVPEDMVDLMLAIGMQENSLRPTHRLDEQGQITDIGTFQIHVATARNYRLNLVRLLVDVNYQVRSAVRIMKKKRALCRGRGISPDWSCYHSYTKSRREKYALLVGQYLRGETLLAEEDTNATN